MAEATFNLCDICGAHTDKACRQFITTGHENDCVGDYAPEGRYVDLCPKHQADLIKVLLSDPRVASQRCADEAQGKRAIDFIDKLKAATKKANA